MWIEYIHIFKTWSDDARGESRERKYENQKYQNTKSKINFLGELI